MPRGRPKKEVVEEIEPIVSADELIESPEAHGLTERAIAEARQLELLELREVMVQNGVDSIGKLDTILSQVNERIRQLTE